VRADYRPSLQGANFPSGHCERRQGRRGNPVAHVANI
jgi:hypothetical protein